MWGIHRRPVNSSHKWPVTGKMFPFEDVIMSQSWMTVRRMLLMAPEPPLNRREMSSYLGNVHWLCCPEVKCRQMTTFPFQYPFKKRLDKMRSDLTKARSHVIYNSCSALQNRPSLSTVLLLKLPLRNLWAYDNWNGNVFLHFDEIFLSGCTKSWHDSICWSQ